MILRKLITHEAIVFTSLFVLTFALSGFWIIYAPQKPLPPRVPGFPGQRPQPPRRRAGLPLATQPVVSCGQYGCRRTPCGCPGAFGVGSAALYFQLAERLRLHCFGC